MDWESYKEQARKDKAYLRGKILVPPSAKRYGHIYSFEAVNKMRREIRAAARARGMSVKRYKKYLKKLKRRIRYGR